MFINTSQGKKKDIKKVPYLINLTSLTVKCSLHTALAQCTLTMLHFKKAFSRKKHYPSISIPFSVWSKQYQQLQTAYCSSYNCLLCFDRHLWKLLEVSKTSLFTKGQLLWWCKFQLQFYSTYVSKTQNPAYNLPRHILHYLLLNCSTIFCV